MAWKIDLSKTYDKLNWNFIFHVLEEVKVPVQICNLIRSCVSSPSFQVLINGSMSRIFSGSRGVRQGDPLSPYLFVLCMEKLSHLIQSSVHDRNWKAVKATRFGPHVSHLFFADDLILFAEASSDQAKVLKRTMDIFCKMSGQSVNFEKSVIFCSSGISREIAKDISSICGSPLTPSLGNYLGMPLIHGRVGRETYAKLIDKVQSRLASWKCKTLSMAGRLTLIQSVSAAIPVYAMQTAKIPISVCDKLDGLNRGFLWGDTAEKKKVHLLNWHSVCRPKLLGGLGIKRSRDMNQAMLAKASWRMCQGDEGLWCKIYANKYLMHSSLLQNYKKSVSCSSTWASVVHGAMLLKKGMIWRIGNGSTVKFWTDKWTDIGRLVDFAINRSFVNEDESVNAYWVEQMWDMSRLSAVLPSDVVEAICAIPIGSANSKDKLIWGASPSGEFSVKSVYLLNFADDVQVAYPWMSNWSLNVPPKIKIFLWSLVAGKILTNVQRVARKFSVDSSCFHCASIPETLIHLFRDCPQARLVWGTFFIPASMLPSFSLDWKGWISANLLHKKIYAYAMPWNVVFSFICWHLWKWRCKCFFEENFNMPYDVREVILSYLEEWKVASLKVKEKSGNSGVVSGWSKPPKDFFKINVDGARSSDGNIGAGGVLRRCDGSWCAGFMARLGVGEVLQAEAWALYHGLHMGLREGAMQVEVESDSSILVNLVMGADISFHPLGSIVLLCRQLMEEFAACSLRYVPRDENAVADSIAKNSLNCSIGVYPLKLVPDFCAEAVLAEAGGMGQRKEVSSARHHCRSSAVGDVLTDTVVEDAGGVARWCRLPTHAVQGSGMSAAEVSYQAMAGSAVAGDASFGRQDGVLVDAGRMGCEMNAGEHGDAADAVLHKQEGARLCSQSVLAVQDGAMYAADGHLLGNIGRRMQPAKGLAGLAEQSCPETSP